MQNILVTGGSGFIGSNFIRHMLNTYEYHLVNLDKLTYAGNLENLKDIEDHARYTFIQGDIIDRDLVCDLFNKYAIDTVVHFAAETHVDRSIDDVAIFLTTNILGTQVLLETAKQFWKLNPQDKYCNKFKEGVKYLQVSTDEVYGTLSDRGKFTEQSPLLPNSPYAASKASADMIVRAYYETFALPINITRCSNNYGPNQFPEKLIPLMIKNALNDIPLPVYGDGMQIRDWLHVKDHCKAIDRVLHEGKIGEIYNIGGDCEKTNLELVKLIIKELAKPEELIKYVQDRPGHDRRYAIDHTKITTQLGWQPRYTFEQGIKETILWYVSQLDGSNPNNNSGSKFHFTKTKIKDLYIIEPTVFKDQRGYFMESYSKRDFFEAGLTMEFVQQNESKSTKGVLRGLHFQTKHTQGKLVRVIKGEVFDVAVDLRDGSPTFGLWEGVLLSEDNKKQFYIPEGFAHGFLVISDEAIFQYKCTDYYAPEYDSGILWNDPDIGIAWQLQEIGEPILSDKDKNQQSFKVFKEQYR